MQTLQGPPAQDGSGAHEGARAARWREEAGYFDAHAPAEVRGIDPRVAVRYATARRFWFDKEYRFRLLGPLAGHRVLDVGCGMGDNAILLALAGGQVTAVDVSPRSIEVAERGACSLRGCRVTVERPRCAGPPPPPRGRRRRVWS